MEATSAPRHIILTNEIAETKPLMSEEPRRFFFIDFIFFFSTSAQVPVLDPTARSHDIEYSRKSPVAAHETQLGH